MGYGLIKLADIVGGGDEKAERALMQEKQKGRFMVDFMPYRKIKVPVPQIGDKEAEGPTYIDLTRFVPGGDIFDIGGNTLPYLPAPVQPNFGLGGEILSPLLGFDLFTQRKLSGLGISEYEDAKTKLRDLYKGLIPNIPFLPGAYSTQRITTAKKGEESPYKVKESELAALFRALGFKFETQSIEKLEALKSGELRRKLSGVNQKVNALNREYDKGLINENTYDKKMLKLENLYEKIADKYDDAFSVYKPENYKNPMKLQFPSFPPGKNKK